MPKLIRAETALRRMFGGARPAVTLPLSQRRKPKITGAGAKNLARGLSKLGVKARLSVAKKKNPMARKAPIPGVGGAPSFSKFMAARPPSKRVSAMKKVGAPNYYITNNAVQLQVDEGFQDFQDFSFQSLADLKQISTYTGLTPRNVKQYVLESCTGEYLITNSSLATMYVDIYDVVRRRDTSGDPNTVGPSIAWSTGVDDEAGASGGALMIGSLPTDSRLFKDYFKVVRRTHVGLSQGATHRHSVNIKSNELLDTEVLNRASGDLAGVTVYTMIVSYGQPASIPGEGGAPATVTTASGYIDIVKSVRYKYTWIEDLATNFYSTDNLSTLAGEQVVSQGAGAIVPNAKV